MKLFLVVRHTYTDTFFASQRIEMLEGKIRSLRETISGVKRSNQGSAAARTDDNSNDDTDDSDADDNLRQRNKNLVKKLHMQRALKQRKVQSNSDVDDA